MNQKILIVDDDKFLIRLYADKLRREGFEVLMDITGAEGLERVIAQQPDLVILDVILPQKNGFDVLSEMKLNPKTRGIPVIILTNLSQESDIKTGRSLGAVEYLIKTEFPIARLGEVVRKWLAVKNVEKTADGNIA